jgi:GT2 family glycosyltransferase
MDTNEHESKQRSIRVTIAIPTLAADSKLLDCVRSLAAQTWRDFEVVIIDNSGKKRARETVGACGDVRFIENDANRGFGAAINQACSGSQSTYVAVLNDDAVAGPRWLGELVSAAESRPEIGMFASQVRLMGRETLDSAGMLICADGSSKQRGHGASPDKYSRGEEALLPSGSAALYRRDMLEQIGGFDEDFFLYCEDTDVGLRARWAGWKCWYAPAALVSHHYSHSAGRATPLKAYYVERNRLFLIVKNFPLPALLAAPLVSIARYWWHLVAMLEGRGAAAKFRQDGESGAGLIAIVIRAHWSLLRNWSALWRKRRDVKRTIPAAEFQRLLRDYSISAREVAEL